MALAVGTQAPDFTLSTITADGPKLVSLADHKGKNVVVLFFPMAFTGVCTQEFCSISEGLGDYTSLNAEVIGVSGDNPFAQAHWAAQEGRVPQRVARRAPLGRR